MLHDVVTTLAPPLSAPQARPASPATLIALVALTKPQLAFMTVLTAMVAYGTARPAAGSALATLLGTTLAAAGALSLNQWWERRADAQMQRTRGRPLPQAQVTPAVALAWSLALSFAGVAVLAALVNLTAAAIAALTILIYGLVYTPLKRRTRWATELGAVSGALPPLLGNAAAGDLWAAPGAALAALLLCWQMPHFFAIGWRHRVDYRAAGFKLLPTVDSTGKQTAGWSLFYAALLLPVSLAPWVLGHLGALYGVTAALAGCAFLWRAGQFVAAPGDRDAAARRLFFASILYLPLVLGALALDRLVAL
jgi:protoheme IX farnesyltransferase